MTSSSAKCRTCHVYTANNPSLRMRPRASAPPPSSSMKTWAGESAAKDAACLKSAGPRSCCSANSLAPEGPPGGPWRCRVAERERPVESIGRQRPRRRETQGQARSKRLVFSTFRTASVPFSFSEKVSRGNAGNKVNYRCAPAARKARYLKRPIRPNIARTAGKTPAACHRREAGHSAFFPDPIFIAKGRLFFLSSTGATPYTCLRYRGRKSSTAISTVSVMSMIRNSVLPHRTCAAVRTPGAGPGWS